VSKGEREAFLMFLSLALLLCTMISTRFHLMVIPAVFGIAAVLPIVYVTIKEVKK
jgi:hypothetical protein